MPGVLTIAKKEFMDHVSGRAFLLSFAILLIAMCASAYYQISLFHTEISILDYFQMPVDEYWKECHHLIVGRLTGQLTTLGALVAAAMSFNSINKERSEGSLKVLLSYPVYRDQVILGKLLAGFLVLLIVTFTSMTLAFSIYIFYISIPLTLDIVLRFLSVTFMGALLLLFYLCLGTAISTVVRDTSTSLLSLLLVVNLFRSRTVEMALTVAGNTAGRLGINIAKSIELLYTSSPFDMVYSNEFLRNYGRVSPAETFRQFALSMFSYTDQIDSSYLDLMYKNEVQGSFQALLLQNLDLVAVQLVFLAAAFALSYIVFTKSDVT